MGRVTIAELRCCCRPRVCRGKRGCRNERAIPLFIVGVLPLAMAGRIARRYAEFRRLSPAELRASRNR